MDEKQDYSLDALLIFLDNAVKRGDLKANTANAWKASCNTLFDILQESEKVDLRRIDVNDVYQRFINKKGGEFKQESLRTYKSRVKKAVTEFLKYKESPDNWKPEISKRITKTSNRNGSSSEGTRPQSKQQDHLVHSFSFPLRDDVTISIQGVPKDLKKSEAKRLHVFLSGVFSALSEDYEEDDSK